MTEKDVNWNNIETWKKRGSLFIKDTIVKDVEWTDKNGETHLEKDVVRHKWTEVDCPMFKLNTITETVNNG